MERVLQICYQEERRNNHKPFISEKFKLSFFFIYIDWYIKEKIVATTKGSYWIEKRAKGKEVMQKTTLIFFTYIA
jgi:hypothetical protein